MTQENALPNQVMSGFMVGTGVGLLAYAIRKRSSVGLLALGAVPLLYRTINGQWPTVDRSPLRATRRALGGSKGIHVHESARLEVPIDEVYSFWRRLENLPRFMSHIDEVSAEGQRSHWVARGPAGMRIVWDAELINDVPNTLIAWRSLPGAILTSAGSVNFDRVRGDSATQVTVKMQYALPAGKVGDIAAMLFRSAPSQTIRDDLRRLKQLLEAGELAHATASTMEKTR